MFSHNHVLLSQLNFFVHSQSGLRLFQYVVTRLVNSTQAGDGHVSYMVLILVVLRVLKKPKVLFALLVIFSMCLFHVKSIETDTPRYLLEVT